MKSRLISVLAAALLALLAPAVLHGQARDDQFKRDAFSQNYADTSDLQPPVLETARHLRRHRRRRGPGHPFQQPVQGHRRRQVQEIQHLVLPRGRARMVGFPPGHDRLVPGGTEARSGEGHPVLRPVPLPRAGVQRRILEDSHLLGRHGRRHLLLYGQQAQLRALQMDLRPGHQHGFPRRTRSITATSSAGTGTIPSWPRRWSM